MMDKEAQINQMAHILESYFKTGNVRKNLDVANVLYNYSYRKPLDRPELREKINGILNQYIIRNLAETIMMDDDWITDQILALLEGELDG